MGRKPKYDEPTETIAFRVPKSKVADVKKMIADYLLRPTNLDVIVAIQKEVHGLGYKTSDTINLECGCVVENNLFKRAKGCAKPKEQHKF